MNSEYANSAAVCRPRLMIYHANAKGTGCATKLTLRPAHDAADGCLMMTFANQMTVGDQRGPTPIYPRFDWDNTITVKLDFNDLCAMLQVFRGETESINGDQGLYHVSVRAMTRICLRHLRTPVQGYSLEVFRAPIGGGDDACAHMLFTTAEAVGLYEAISGVMGAVCFGIPMLLPQDMSKSDAMGKEVRNVSAA